MWTTLLYLLFCTTIIIKSGNTCVTKRETFMGCWKHNNAHWEGGLEHICSLQSWWATIGFQYTKLYFASSGSVQPNVWDDICEQVIKFQLSSFVHNIFNHDVKSKIEAFCWIFPFHCFLVTLCLQPPTYEQKSIICLNVVVLLIITRQHFRWKRSNILYRKSSLHLICRVSVHTWSPKFTTAKKAYPAHHMWHTTDFFDWVGNNNVLFNNAT